MTALTAALTPLGAVAKTTGAGGGDVIAIAAPTLVAPAAVTDAIIGAGLTPLTLAIDPRGVAITPAA